MAFQIEGGSSGMPQAGASAAKRDVRVLARGRSSSQLMFKGSGRSTVFLIGRWGRLFSDTLLQYDASWCNEAWTGGAS